MRRRFIEFLIPLALILALVVVVRVYPVELLNAASDVFGSVGNIRLALVCQLKAQRLEMESVVARSFKGEDPVWIELPESHRDQAITAYLNLIPYEPGVTFLFADPRGSIEVCIPASRRNAFTVEALEAARLKRNQGE